MLALFLEHASSPTAMLTSMAMISLGVLGALALAWSLIPPPLSLSLRANASGLPTTDRRRLLGIREQLGYITSPWAQGAARS